MKFTKAAPCYWGHLMGLERSRSSPLHHTSSLSKFSLRPGPPPYCLHQGPSMWSHPH